MVVPSWFVRAQASLKPLETPYHAFEIGVNALLEDFGSDEAESKLLPGRIEVWLREAHIEDGIYVPN